MVKLANITTAPTVSGRIFIQSEVLQFHGIIRHHAITRRSIRTLRKRRAASISSVVMAQNMEFYTEQNNSLISSVISTLLVVASSTVCMVLWYKTSHIGYIMSSVGFLIVAPVWYQAPFTVSRFKEPIGKHLKTPRMLSKPNQVLSLVGYPVILIGFCYVLLF